METIYKYVIPVEDEFTLQLPDGARVLSVQVQNGTPCLWALIDPERPTTRRHFRLAGTGHPIDDASGLAFIETFQMHGGALVFHVFERINSKEPAS